MRIVIRERAEFQCTPRSAFDHTNDAASLTSFVGYGPIPGIREARYITPDPVGLGSRRTVTKSDGTNHLEEITEFVPGQRHVTRISGLAGAFGILVKDLHDIWEFDLSPRGTALVTRTFVINTRAAAVPIALALVPFLRRAIRRDLRNTQQAIELTKKVTPDAMNSD